MLTESIDLSVCHDEEDYPVTCKFYIKPGLCHARNSFRIGDTLKEYSVMIKSYDEKKPCAERGYEVPSSDEGDHSPKGESNQNFDVGGPQLLIIGEWPRHLSGNSCLDTITRKI